MRKCRYKYNNTIPNEFWDKENKRNINNLKFSICFGVIISVIFTSVLLATYAKSPDNKHEISNQIKPNISRESNYYNNSAKVQNGEIEVDNVLNQRLENATNDYILNYSQQLGGAMSEVVSMSISPLTSLTILSTIGTLQSNDSDKYLFLKQLVDMSRSLPIDFSSLPLANWNSVIAIFLIFIVLFVLRTLHYTKVFTIATINRIESWFGQIIAVLIIFSTTSATTAYAASVVTTQSDDISIWIYILTTSFSIIASIASGIIYYFIKTVCLCLEILVFLSSSLLPPPVAVVVSGVFETVKGVAVLCLTLLTFLNPVVSIIVSAIISAICIYFFKKSYTVVVYFKFIYIKPFWNAIINRRKLLPLVWDTLPNKILNNFPNIVIAVPIFPLKKIREIGKKEKCWYIFDGETSYICKNYLFRKPICISFSELLEDGYTVHLQKRLRFLRVFSDEQLIDSHKRVLFVISREYNNQFQDLLDIAGFENYNELIETRKEERKVANEEKKKQKREEKMSKILSKKDKKLEMLEKKQEFLLEAEKRKQLIKLKEKEFKDNIRRVKKEGVETDIINYIDEHKVISTNKESEEYREQSKGKKTIDFKKRLTNIKEKAQGEIINISDKMIVKIDSKDEMLSKITLSAEKVKDNINMDTLKDNGQKVIGGFNKIVSKIKKGK